MMQWLADFSVEVAAGIVVAAVLGVTAYLWHRKRSRPNSAAEPVPLVQPSVLADPTAPEQGTLQEMLSLLHRDMEPWAFSLVAGHRYKLANRMQRPATNVRVSMDRAVSHEWPVIGVAQAVTFVCHPGWGSDRVLHVEWDSADYVDGRARWQADL